jgi:hypothetical protein
MPSVIKERPQQVQQKSERRLGSRTPAKETPKWVKPTIWCSIGGVVLIIIASVVATKVSNARAAARRTAAIRAGSAAALVVVEKLKPIAQEYVDFRKAQPKKSWQPRQLESAALGLPADLPVDDVLVVYGQQVPVASLSGAPKPMSGSVERSPEPSVEVHSGKYTSAGGGAILWFRAPIDASIAGEKLWAFLIVRRDGD